MTSTRVRKTTAEAWTQDRLYRGWTLYFKLKPDGYWVYLMPPGKLMSYAASFGPDASIGPLEVRAQRWIDCNIAR